MERHAFKYAFNEYAYCTNDVLGTDQSLGDRIVYKYRYDPHFPMGRKQK